MRINVWNVETRKTSAGGLAKHDHSFKMFLIWFTWDHCKIFAWEIVILSNKILRLKIEEVLLSPCLVMTDKYLILYWQNFGYISLVLLSTQFQLNPLWPILNNSTINFDYKSGRQNLNRVSLANWNWISQHFETKNISDIYLIFLCVVWDDSNLKFSLADPGCEELPRGREL